MNSNNFFSTTKVSLENRTPPPASYFVYDYESYTNNPRETDISQLAAIQLNQNGIPLGTKLNKINFYVKPKGDQIISPMASLITKITMSDLFNPGHNNHISELELAFRLFDAMTKEKNTCIVGYNNISFDDTITESLFFRNFLSPFQWRSFGNSRIDLLPIVVAFHTLCPYALANWPRNEETNKYSYKLEHMSKCNNIAHNNVHDAFSDVEACIGLIQLFMKTELAEQVKPLLADKENLDEINVVPLECFNYLIEFRNKNQVNAFLDSVGKDLVVYFSSMFSRETRGAIPVLVLNNWLSKTKFKSNNSNKFLINLLADPQELKEFFNYSEEDFTQYYSLGNKYRKLRSPILRVGDNKFPLFASLDKCSLNKDLNTEEIQNRIKLNSLFLKTIDLNAIANIIVNSNDEGYKNQPPSELTNKNLVKAEDESLEKDKLEAEQKIINDLKDKYPQKFTKTFEQINQEQDKHFNITYYPDRQMYGVLDDLFRSSISSLFSPNKGLNPEAFVSYLSYISLNPVFNNLYLRYMGLNFYNYLSNDQKLVFLDMLLKRLEISYEKMKNDVIDLRIEAILGKTPYSNNDIANTIQDSENYYNFSKKNILDEMELVREKEAICQAERQALNDKQ